MRLWTKLAFVLLFVPLVASAQFKDLDSALSNLNRGFGSGDVQAIVAGIGDGEQVQLDFRGLIDQKDVLYGKDQAAYLLDGLFNKAKPSDFQPTSSRGGSAEGQYHMTAKWTVSVAGKADARNLYITLRKKGDRWSIASVRSGS
ncbi:MAG TPA: DUF4783 domain-containing protein [Thermoanaerobaculia bacterium]